MLVEHDISTNLRQVGESGIHSLTQGRQSIDRQGAGDAAHCVAEIGEEDVDRRYTAAGMFLQRRGKRAGGRSEEHTSELQSLMRSSLAVFGWEQKTQRQHEQEY